MGRKTIHDNGVYFLTDAQLSRSENRKLIERHPELSLLMTGSIHGYGKAKDYYESGRAELVLWPNHMTEREMWELAGKIISEKLFLITAQTGNRSLMYFLYKRNE